jgi:hypothetical protein
VDARRASPPSGIRPQSNGQLTTAGDITTKEVFTMKADHMENGNLQKSLTGITSQTT